MGGVSQHADRRPAIGGLIMADDHGNRVSAVRRLVSIDRVAGRSGIGQLGNEGVD